jgi:two-component system, cell cycle response regulator
MKSKTRITATLLFSMSIVFMIIIGIIAYDIRESGIHGARAKAETVANIVQMGLTSYMVHGIMDDRQQFIRQIENLEGLDRVWIARGESVTRQYGKGLSNEALRDAIDKQVLNTGKRASHYEDNMFGHSIYRVTIPYNAASGGSIDCLQCHDAQEGDTLGIITIEIDIDDFKELGIWSIIYTALFALMLIIFIVTFVNRLTGPYIAIFGSIKNVMKKADGGDYSGRVSVPDNSGESKEVAQWINTLLVKLETTLEEIEQKTRVFLAHKRKEESDPLNEVKKTVTRLSNIYRFRKAIEHDEHIDEVYERFAGVLRQQFKLQNFNFIEADTTNKKTEVIHTEREILCDAVNGCRADRTNTVVDSCQFESICKRMPKFEGAYICIPYSISNDLDFILSIVTEDPEEAKRVRTLVPLIQDYVDAAKPEIVSKKLTQLLEKSARTDALTGLYNRQFLEESIDKITQQANRAETPYGVLMVDIDFFKMINDTYGHDVGDEAIRVIAQTLEENTRVSDLVIRFGGEEFIVLLYNCEADHVVEVAEKIREAFARKKIKAGPGKSFSKTISIGAAIYPEQSGSFWRVIKYADTALYKAKNGGRNRVVLFDETMKEAGELEDQY